MNLAPWAEAICQLADRVVKRPQLRRHGDLAEVGCPAKTFAFEDAASDPEIQLPLAVGEGAFLVSRASSRRQFMPVCRENFSDG